MRRCEVCTTLLGLRPNTVPSPRSVEGTFETTRIRYDISSRVPTAKPAVRWLAFHSDRGLARVFLQNVVSTERFSKFDHSEACLTFHDRCNMTHWRSSSYHNAYCNLLNTASSGQCCSSWLTCDAKQPLLSYDDGANGGQCVARVTCWLPLTSLVHRPQLS